MSFVIQFMCITVRSTGSSLWKWRPKIASLGLRANLVIVTGASVTGDNESLSKVVKYWRC